jgi:hypothetical protein
VPPRPQIPIAEVAGDSPERDALGPAGSTDDSFVVSAGIDGLERTLSCSGPGSDALVMAAAERCIQANWVKACQTDILGVNRRESARAHA